MESVVNVTLNPARRQIHPKEKYKDERYAEKENSSKLPSAKESWILEMLSRDSVHLSKLRRNPNECVKYKRNKNNLSITRNREGKQFYVVPNNGDEFSLS